MQVATRGLVLRVVLCLVGCGSAMAIGDGSPVGPLRADSDSVLNEWMSLFQELFWSKMSDTSPRIVEAYLARMLELEKEIFDTDSIDGPRIFSRLSELIYQRYPALSVNPLHLTSSLREIQSLGSFGCGIENVLRSIRMTQLLNFHANLREFLQLYQNNLFRDCWLGLTDQLKHEKQKLEALNMDAIKRVFAIPDPQPGWASLFIEFSVGRQHPMIYQMAITNWSAYLVLDLMQDRGFTIEGTQPADRAAFARQYDRLVTAPCRKVYGRTHYLLSIIDNIMFQQGYQWDYMSAESLTTIKRTKFCQQVMLVIDVLDRAFSAWQTQLYFRSV